MIVDCVLFHDEWECLEIRVRELDGLVDIHHVIEGDRTFSGELRPAASFRRLLDISPKIIRTTVSLADLPSAWEREYAQRNAILRAIANREPADLILISDVDEIPRRESFEQALELAEIRDCVGFECQQFYFKLNWRDAADKICGPRLLKRKNLTEPQRLRSINPRGWETPLDNAGWHFGWLGTPERAKAHIEAFAHQELNTPDIANVAFLETCQRLRMTAHNGHLLQKLKIDDSFPLAVRERPERYAHLIDP